MLLKIYSSKICYWRTLSRCSCWCKDCYNTKSCRRTQIMTASPRTSWSLKLVTKFRMWTTRESGYLSQKVRMKQSLLLRKLVDTSLKVLDWVQHPGWCLRLATTMTWLGDHSQTVRSNPSEQPSEADTVECYYFCTFYFHSYNIPCIGCKTTLLWFHRLSHPS